MYGKNSGGSVMEEKAFWGRTPQSRCFKVKKALRKCDVIDGQYPKTDIHLNYALSIFFSSSKLGELRY